MIKNVDDDEIQNKSYMYRHAEQKFFVGFECSNVMQVLRISKMIYYHNGLNK